MALNLQAFIDDSRTDDGEFVLAGHIATAEAWAEFAKEWEILLPLGTRAKNGKFHFKMSEMALSPERMARVPTFYRAIEDHVITSISCQMNQLDFMRAKERVKLLTRNFGWSVNFAQWENPYFALFRGLLDMFHTRREEFASRLPLDQKVDFIFDNQTEKAIILKVWDEYIEMRDDEVKDRYGAAPRFENDQEFLPLQGADLWAWWVREWYEEDATPLPDRMRDFDFFGHWRGKKRPSIAISMDEDDIVNNMQGLAFLHADALINSAPSG